MNTWSPGSVLFWLAVAIFVPALLVHFTLGRKGGHHLFDRDGLTPEETRSLPFEMLRRRTVWQLQRSAATLVGVLVVMVLGLTLGPALYRKWHDA